MAQALVIVKRTLFDDIQHIFCIPHLQRWGCNALVVFISQSTPQPASPYVPTYLLHCAYYVRPSHRAYSACSKPKRAKPV